jgi:hypothetical protein
MILLKKILIFHRTTLRQHLPIASLATTRGRVVAWFLAPPRAPVGANIRNRSADARWRRPLT